MPQTLAHVSVGLVVLLSAVSVIAADLPASSLSEQQAMKTLSLEPFGKISICLPLNVLITPSTPSEQVGDGLSQYHFKLDGQPSVLSSIQGSVRNGTLHLESEASFKIGSNVKLTVSPHSYSCHLHTLSSKFDILEKCRYLGGAKLC